MEDRCEPTEILSDINLAKQQQAAGGGMKGQHHGNLFTSSTKKFRKRLSFFWCTLSITGKGNLATTDVDLIFNTWNWFINNKFLLGKLFCLNMWCMMWEQSGYRALRFRLSRPTVQQCNNHGNAPGCIGWLVGRVAYDTFIPGLESRDSFVTNCKKWGNMVWQELEIW